MMMQAAPSLTVRGAHDSYFIFIVIVLVLEADVGFRPPIICLLESCRHLQQIVRSTDPETGIDLHLLAL